MLLEHLQAFSSSLIFGKVVISHILDNQPPSDIDMSVVAFKVKVGEKMLEIEGACVGYLALDLFVPSFLADIPFRPCLLLSCMSCGFNLSHSPILRG